MSSPCRVLVVEDDASMRAILRYNLVEEGCEVTLAERGDEGLAIIRRGPPAASASRAPFDLVLTDVKMPGADGMAVLAAAKEAWPEVPVLLVTAFGTVDHAVEALEAGAADYITKPFRRAELKARVRQALETARLRHENEALRTAPSPRGRRTEILTSSPKMRQVLAVLRRVATADVAVLVQGESGTGKELAARLLHEESGREGALVPINCAALPPELLESALFGHERGAFTGAAQRHAGKFEQAHKGTLFLDEVGEMPLPLQAKLLRVLEDGVVDPVGSARRIPVDVRVVAATNRDLAADVAAGRFREDLYHRLSVIPVTLPPLRERPEDIPLLVAHFLRERGDEAVTVAPALLAELARRPWPGNIRELKNTVARMALLRRGDTLDLADLAAPGQTLADTAPGPALAADGVGGVGAGASGDADREVADGRLCPGALTLPPEPFSLPELEREIIEKALEMHDQNRSAAARYLGIPRHVLLYRLSKYEADGGAPSE